QGSGAPVQLFVIRLKHARASDVAATVNLLFGAGGEFSGRAGLATRTLSDELRRNVVPPTGGAAAPPPGQPAPSGPKPASLLGPVTIVPDELTNSLLIRASQVDFEVLRQGVEQLDIRPLQVLIEVMIVEARHDRSFSFGSDLFLPPQSLDKGNGTVDATSAGGGLGDLVIHQVAEPRSEEHTSELQSLAYLVCRLLLEKKKTYDGNGRLSVVIPCLRSHHGESCL